MFQTRLLQHVVNALTGNDTNIVKPESLNLLVGLPMTADILLLLHFQLGNAWESQLVEDCRNTFQAKWRSVSCTSAGDIRVSLKFQKNSQCEIMHLMGAQLVLESYDVL